MRHQDTTSPLMVFAFWLLALTGVASAQQTWCRDVDGDSYGDPNDSVVSATQPPGYVANCSDCADMDSSINPGRSDNNCNNIDNDCDGQIDEDFTGTCTAGVGGCERLGARICQGGNVICTAVPGSPTAEICNDRIDNDCDGLTDEGCGPIGVESRPWFHMKVLYR